MKKVYFTPTLEIIEMDAENVIAGSPGIDSGNGSVSGGGGLSNKRQPVNNSWGSQNWDKDGE